MNRRVVQRRMSVAALVLASIGHRAAADDWLQFRHDDRRTAVSRDRLQLPLTDVWTMPGYGTATWHGKAFYLGPDGARAAVYCADLRTGATLWKQPLNFAWSEMWVQLPLQRTPVAVSSDGVVYVQDSVPGTRSYVLMAGSESETPYKSVPFRHVPRGVLRTFRATDGAPLAVISSPPRGLPVSQLYLYDEQNFGIAPTRPVVRGMIPVGPVLLQGKELIATSIDCLFRWTPGGVAELMSLAHMRPKANINLRMRDVAMSGFPPTNSGTGTVIGGSAWLEQVDRDHFVGDKQFLAHMSAGKCRWHVDYPWSLGFPTVDKDLILTGAGGGAAQKGVMAHDVNTGVVRWVYSPEKLVRDGVFGGTSTSFRGDFEQRNGAIVRNEFNTTVERQYYPGAAPDAYVQHPGIPVAGGRAYAWVANSIVCLDVETGEPRWKWDLPHERGYEGVGSLVLTPEHLLVSHCGETRRGDAAGSQSSPRGRLVALRLADGKVEWSLALPRAGQLALSDGLLFLNDDSIHAFAPAERTYRMAVDSTQRVDYDPAPGLNRDPLPPASDARSPENAAAPKPGPGVADASIVRLYWGDPVEEMVKQLRERRAVAPGLPLLVSLDWLDPTRTTIRGGQSSWSARDIAAFAALCERLAREVTPEHLDLAPDVNVYLSRDARWLPSVRLLLRTAVKAVKQVSPQTKVLVSFNREVLARKYGCGRYAPFGKVVFGNQEEQKALLAVFEDVDEVGLTSLPQSAFNSPLEIPGDYLLGLKATLPKKPILITRLAMRWDGDDKTPETTQASYLKHLIQVTYWLNAELVAYPELLGTRRTLGEVNSDLALRVEDQERLALAYWRDTLQWKRVPKLTAPAATFEEMPP